MKDYLLSFVTARNMTQTHMEMSDYEQGYRDAIDDVEAAMKAAEASVFNGETVLSFNHPEMFANELKRLHEKRFN